MAKRVTIDSVMHRFPHTIGTQQTLKSARNMMLEHNIRHLPVKEGGKLVGILSERDIDFALRVDKKDPEELRVLDAFLPEPYTVTPDTLVADVARRMAHDHIGCALVTENDKLVGIFTTVDACRVLAEVLSGHSEQ